MLVRVARSIHIKTTASGWMKQTSSSTSFFMIWDPHAWHDQSHGVRSAYLGPVREGTRH